MEEDKKKQERRHYPRNLWGKNKMWPELEAESDPGTSAQQERKGSGRIILDQ